MTKLTFEDLARQLQRAATCSSATVPSKQLLEILDLAERAKGLDALDLRRLRETSEKSEVRITGAELRYVLALALQAVQPRSRPTLLLVRSQT